MSLLGVLGAGLATTAGVAMDNPYLVGGGANAAGFYATKYDEFSTSLVEEQRLQRLADAQLVRQKSLEKYSYDMKAPERELQQQNWQATFEEGSKVNQANITHLQNTDRINELEYKEGSALRGAQTALINKQSDPAYMKQMAQAQAEAQVASMQVINKYQSAEVKKQLVEKEAQIDATVKDPKQAEILKNALRLQSLGIDLTAFQGKPLQLNQEALQKVFNDAGAVADTMKPIADKLNSNSPEIVKQGQIERAEFQSAAVKTYSSLVYAYSGGGGSALGGLLGGGEPPPVSEDQINAAALVIYNNVKDKKATFAQYENDPEASDPTLALALQRAKSWSKGRGQQPLPEAPAEEKVQTPESALNFGFPSKEQDEMSKARYQMELRRRIEESNKPNDMSLTSGALSR